MAVPNKAVRNKRDRERSKQEHQQEKREKRAFRSEMKKERDQLTADGIDPDLAGIVAGPQPIQD